MRSRIAFILTAYLPFIGCLSAQGQEPTLLHRYPLLRGQSVRPEVIGNRLTVLCSPSAHSRNFSTPSQHGDLLETLSIQFDNGHLRMRYESLSEGRFVLEVIDRRQVRLQREISGKRVLYEQPTVGPIRLEVTVGSKQETRTADGLWQMLLFDSMAKAELLPLLEQLSPGWRLSEQVSLVEDALLAAARSSALVDRAKWGDWLQQLASSDYRVRVSAERKLREAGIVALGWLERQESSALDPEQRSHLVNLRADLLPTRADTPDLVAAWLVDDKRVWISFLKHEDMATRTLAREQLGALCGRTIPFDPQADAALRNAQLARLESRIGK